MNRFLSRLISRPRGNRVRQLPRLARFEQLETREVLSAPTIAAIPDFDIYQGAPLPIALQGLDSDGDALSYTITSTAPNSLKTATTASTNRSLQITMQGFGNDANTTDGVMTLQLFEDLAPLTTAKIIGLAQQGTYTESTFHRIIKDFMIQGGIPKNSSTTVPNIDDEFNTKLQMTRDGILAMANAGDDTGNSQFFITAEPTRWLDFQHTIFGFLTGGDDVRERIAAVPADQNSGSVTGAAPVMKSVSVVTDQQRGVALLTLDSLPASSADIDVTVEVTDAQGNKAHTSFKVHPHADTTNDPPFVVNPPTQVSAAQNTATTVQIHGTDAENDAIKYAAALQAANANIAVSTNPDTGVVTITPSNNVTGVYGLVLKASDGIPDPNGTITYDTQTVPLYISPAVPGSITLLNPTQGTDTTTADNSAGHLMQFRVAGVQSGAVVVLSADSREIARGTATGTSIDLTTNGTATLSVGAHAVTAVQTLANQTVSVGNVKTTVDLASPATASTTIHVAADVRGSTPGVYDPSTSHFHLRNSITTGVEDKWVAYGEVNTAHPWLPVIGDWDGDGVETIGLYNPNNAAFYLKNSNTSGYADVVIAFGTPGNDWTPIAGDWNGDGIDTVGLYDPATSMFYLRNSRTSGIAEIAFVFGTPGANAKPVAGDWDGDKTDTIGLYGTNDHFSLRNSNSAGVAAVDFVFGSNAGSGANIVPVAGDWGAKGSDRLGLYNTSTNEMRWKDANTADAAITNLFYGYQLPNSSSLKLDPAFGAWLGTSNS